MVKRSISFSFLILSISLMFYAQKWDEPKKISEWWNTHEIAFDSDNNIYMVWPWRGDVGFTKSTDSGETWSAIKDLTNSLPNLIGDPDIAIDSNNNLYVVFEYNVAETNDPPRKYQLFFTKSEDRGETWTPPTQIAESLQNALWPRIVIDSNDIIHIIWHDTYYAHSPSSPPPGQHVDFCHTKSSDGGTSWSLANLIVSGRGAWTLDAAVDSQDNLYAFWSLDGVVSCYKSTDGGTSWTFCQFGWGEYLAAAIDSEDVIHVVWTKRTGNEYEHILFYQKSEDRAETWRSAQELALIYGPSYWNPESWPAIAVDPHKTVIVAYQDRSSGNFEIYCRRSPNSGRTWQKKEKLTNTAWQSLQPSLFIDKNYIIHLLWNEVVPEGPFYSDLFYIRGFLRGQGK